MQLYAVVGGGSAYMITEVINLFMKSHAMLNSYEHLSVNVAFVVTYSVFLLHDTTSSARHVTPSFQVPAIPQGHAAYDCISAVHMCGGHVLLPLHGAQRPHRGPLPHLPHPPPRSHRPHIAPHWRLSQKLPPGYAFEFENHTGRRVVVGDRCIAV
ncbi:unnamed protein product [Closterium sp. NIES-64]|nr:unnamed protein product [Closterium sp. NIES-64]